MKTFKLLLILLITAGLMNSRAQDTWTQKADFGGMTREYAIGFSIDNKGYMGTGGVWDSEVEAYINYKDFWQYDPSTDVWTQKADFGGTARNGAVGFSIGNKGYVGTGISDGSVYDNAPKNKDFWEYNPYENSWTQKSDFGGTARWRATGFTLNGKGYITTGYDDGNEGWPFKKDLWVYVPTTDTWTQMADFGGNARYDAIGFSIGNKGYVGTGMEYILSGYLFDDFWEYDPSTDTWLQKANFTGGGRKAAIGFSIGNKGFLGTGSDQDTWPFSPTKDFWEYNPLSDTWAQTADAGDKARNFAVAFVIHNKGYIGTGGNYEVPDCWYFFNDCWEFTPAALSICVEPTGLTVSGITNTSAILNWDEIPFALGYVIKYDKDGGNENAKVTYSKYNSKPISGLAPNTTYFWRVKSVCSEEPKVVSDWSEKQYFTTAPLKVANQQTTTMELYPNPAAENFTLNIQLPTLSNQAADIFLLNTLGQVLYLAHASTGNGTLNQVIVMPATAASGWYVVRVLMSDQVIEQKLLYQK